MVIVHQSSVFFILIIFNDLPEISIDTSVTLSFAVVLELFLQDFDRFFATYIYFDVIFYIIYIFVVDAFSFNGGILLNYPGGLRIFIFQRCKLMQYNVE